MLWHGLRQADRTLDRIQKDGRKRFSDESLISRLANQLRGVIRSLAYFLNHPGPARPGIWFERMKYGKEDFALEKALLEKAFKVFVTTDEFARAQNELLASLHTLEIQLSEGKQLTISTIAFALFQLDKRYEQQVYYDVQGYRDRMYYTNTGLDTVARQVLMEQLTQSDLDADTVTTVVNLLVPVNQDRQIPPAAGRRFTL